MTEYPGWRFTCALILFEEGRDALEELWAELKGNLTNHNAPMWADMHRIMLEEMANLDNFILSEPAEE